MYIVEVRAMSVKETIIDKKNPLIILILVLRF